MEYILARNFNFQYIYQLQQNKVLWDFFVQPVGFSIFIFNFAFQSTFK